MTNHTHDTEPLRPRQFAVARFRVPKTPFEDGFPPFCPFATTSIAWSLELECNVLHAISCKRWGCEYCGPRKAAKLSFKVDAAKPNRLVTLTVDPKFWDSPRAAYDGTRRKLPKFVTRIRKHHGEFEYLRVLEVTKAGWPHYHMMVRSGYIPQPEIKAVWAEQTGATIVDVRRIYKAEHARRYCLKYLCKQKYVPWTDRRVTFSKGFFVDKPSKTLSTLGLQGAVWYSDSPRNVIADHFGGCQAEQVGSDMWAILPSTKDTP